MAIIVVLVIVLIAVICSGKRNPEKKIKKMAHYRNDVVVDGGVDIRTGKLINDKGKYFDKSPGLTSETVAINQDIRRLPKHKIVLTQKGGGTVYNGSFVNRIVIGRNNQSGSLAAITIVHDNTVSGEHCAISEHGGQFFIQDCGSRNHTFINGKVVTGFAPIKTSDVLKIGASSYIVQIE